MISPNCCHLLCHPTPTIPLSLTFRNVGVRSATPCISNSRCKKIIKISVVKLQTKSTNLIICCIYRAPSGNTNQYLELLDNTWKHLHHSSVELLLCGNMNVNYVIEKKNELKLNMIMNAYNLEQIVDIPTRVYINKGTPTDDTFLDRAQHNRILVYPFIMHIYIQL